MPLDSELPDAIPTRTSLGRTESRDLRGEFHVEQLEFGIVAMACFGWISSGK
jgi:hypothetical protein